MHTPSFVRPLVAALIALGPWALQAAEFSGRSVNRFDSGTGCPVETASHACNRIALDDADTRASLSVEQKTIRFDNARHYPHGAVVGDVLLHGSAQTQAGRTVPVSVHVLVKRSGNTWSSSVHAHTPVDGKLAHVSIDAYRVTAGDQVLYQPADGLKAVGDPSLAAQLANELVQVHPNTPPAAAGKGRVSDITVALGVGRVAKPMMRTRLTVADGAAPLADALRQGSWELELQALSSHVPLEVVQRDLFLFGLDQQALLQPLREHGFAKQGTLVIGSAEGRGYLRYGGQRADFEAAPATAQAFLQDSFIGLILANPQAR